MPKNKKLALNSGIQTNQILINDDEVCIPRLSSILLAVYKCTQMYTKISQKGHSLYRMPRVLFVKYTQWVFLVYEGK